METVFITIGVIFSIIALIFSDRTYVVILSFLGSMLFIGGALELCDKNKPEATDVYRGRIEIKITGEYKDSVFIPTDTTVVFKKSD